MTIDRGHNNPPEMLDLVADVASTISEFMSDTPVVETEQQARDYKVQIDRAKLCYKDLEGERDKKVRPLNEQVSAINTSYRKPKATILGLQDEMLTRLDAYLYEVEQARLKVAREAERKAREAEAAAREAERIEQEKLDNAAQGEVGVDVAAVMSEADEAFEAYAVAEREALLAKKATVVKVGGGFTRSLRMRDHETLNVVDAIAALTELGATEKIKEAILISAKAYRKLNNRLPKGVEATIKRGL